ncbi:MAG: hypothetical protein NTU44_16915, partial [Bacteroidetes bacterium]|nr:hypothetical protein [Bacteroidota bacterium]
RVYYKIIMKQKVFIFLGLTLLLLVIIIIAGDLFSGKKKTAYNPFAYNLDSIKNSDTTSAAYTEILSFKPRMEEIHGIDVDRYDHIFVAGKGAVEMYDGSGKLLNAMPIQGTARCIKVDMNGNLFLGMEDHIEIRDSRGKLVNIWKRESEESIITSIGISGKDVFVADAGMATVLHYNKKGILLERIGEKDLRKGVPGFTVPSPYFDLGFNPEGKLWVVNPGRHELEEYDSEGTLVSRWGTASMSTDGFCGCCNPSNIAFLADGSFVTSEKGIERVKVYDKEGKFRDVVAFPGLFEEGTRGLDLGVDSRNRILVLDPVKKLIRIFSLKTGS